MKDRTGQMRQIPKLRDAVTELQTEMKANTETLKLLQRGLLYKTAQQAALSQTVLEKLPLKTSHDVDRFLGQPMYRYGLT